MFSVKVQVQDFNAAKEAHALHQLEDGETGSTGAVVTFTGYVREFSGSTPMTLQHYPGMTERVLDELIQEARSKWDITAACIIHRVGQLSPTEQIVFVGVGSRHRKNAFSACEFLIDTLKTSAPFWKKEGDCWVEAKQSDQVRADRWRTPDTSDAPTHL